MSIKTFWQALFFNNSLLQNEKIVIFRLRMPRTIIAILVGMALSISGFLFQETFRNKLASPNLLGVSNGASVGGSNCYIIRS
ncbi:iron chelate uptake ABC transporter family permease subunit [Metamycoplasma buccale]|uniref:iron chelate uptake ABC transporter family permease subunit n=1 Tax=Metamycoplasma buccale TaxID=55602 RepID=UPI00398F22CE